MKFQSKTLNLEVSKKQMTKFMSAKYQKMFIKSKLNDTENSKTRGANSVDPEEVAHYETTLLDIRCMQSQLPYSAYWDTQK